MRKMQTHTMLERIVATVFTLLLAGGSAVADDHDGATEIPVDSTVRKFSSPSTMTETTLVAVPSEDAWLSLSAHTSRAKVATLLNLSPW